MQYKMRSSVTFFRNKENSIDLTEIYSKIPESNYVENMNGIATLVISLLEPKSKFILYKDGRVLCMGMNNLQNARKSNLILQKFLRERGFKYRFLKAKVKNMVLTINIGKEINLGELNNTLDNSDYEPEQFPGLVHRLLSEKNKITLLIFKSGKMVVTGVKTSKDLKTAKDYIKKLAEKIK